MPYLWLVTIGSHLYGGKFGIPGLELITSLPTGSSTSPDPSIRYTGLASFNGTLYASNANLDIVAIEPSSLSATDPTDLSFRSLAWHEGQLYGGEIYGGIFRLKTAGISTLNYSSASDIFGAIAWGDNIFYAAGAPSGIVALHMDTLPSITAGPSTDGSEFYSVTYNGTVLLGVVSSAGIIVKLTVPPAPVQPQVAACFDLSTLRLLQKRELLPKRTSIIVGPRRTKPMATARLPDGTLITFTLDHPFIWHGRSVTWGDLLAYGILPLVRIPGPDEILVVYNFAAGPDQWAPENMVKISPGLMCIGAQALGPVRQLLTQPNVTIERVVNA